MTIDELKRFIDENTLDGECFLTIEVNGQVLPIEQIWIQDEEFGEIRLSTNYEDKESEQ